MTLIAYHPPKPASHGHRPRVRGCRKAWEATKTFLREQTSCTLRDPLKLTLWGPSQWTSEEVVQATRAEAVRAFGPATSISGEFHNWELTADRLQEALEFAFADDMRPKQQLGPSSLYLSYALTWKSMPNPASLPAEHFQHGSLLGVAIGGRKLFIQPKFLFGASDDDPSFKAALLKLEAAMPFAPKDTYYCRVEAKKTGTGEKLVKLPRG